VIWLKRTSVYAHKRKIMQGRKIRDIGRRGKGIQKGKEKKKGAGKERTKIPRMAIT
jgi:hypothetical protein